jgi:hypothetical protein
VPESAWKAVGSMVGTVAQWFAIGYLGRAAFGGSRGSTSTTTVNNPPPMAEIPVEEIADPGRVPFLPGRR